MDRIKKYASIFISLVFIFTASAYAMAGANAEKLERAGFMCFPAGPSDWTHCWKVKDFSQPAIAVKVFSYDGMDFLGTELLIHEDHYSGQPCPQDGGDWEHQVVIPYFACHHFYTGHHN
jgi:hypothetical protein